METKENFYKDLVNIISLYKNIVDPHEMSGAFKGASEFVRVWFTDEWKKEK